MIEYELAELNIAKMKAPLTSRVMADFVANLDRINRLAEGSPGFVWRLQTDGEGASALPPLGEDTLVNISVWKDVASLHAYAYETAHSSIMRRRKEWFERMSVPSLVLWWVPVGHRPTLGEALEALECLRAKGPGPDAFTFSQPHPPPDR